MLLLRSPFLVARLCSVSRVFRLCFSGTKRLVSVNICLVEGNSAGVFVSEVSPGILVVKRR